MGDEQLKAFYFQGGDLGTLAPADILRLQEIMRTTAPAQLPPGFRVLAPPASTTDIGDADPKQFVKGLLNAGTHALELGAGFAVPGGFIPQMAAAGTSGLVGGGLRGLINGENLLDKAGEGAASNAMLQGGAGAVEALAPRVALPLSLFLGGAKGAFPKSTMSDLVEPFLRQFEKTGTGVSVGNVAKSAALRKPLNEEIAALESSVSGHPLRMRELRGATNPLREQARVTGTHPTSERADLRSAESGIIKEHIQSGAGQLREPGKTPVRVPDRYKTAREGFELARGLRKDARAFMRQKEGGAFTTTSRDINPQANLAVATKIDEILDPIMRSNPPTSRGFANAGDQRDEINSLLSDLYKQEEISSAIRGGGGVISDVGAMGSRGGLASGTLGNVLSATGQTAPPLKGIGTLLGMVGLAPRPISAAGYGAAHVAKSAPTLERLRQALADLGLLNDTPILREHQD